MEKIFEKEAEKILKVGEKKYLTITYKKSPILMGIKLHGVIMRINAISKDDDLLVSHVNILDKKLFSQESLVFFQGGHVSISKLKQRIDTIRPSRLIEIFSFRILEFKWRFNIKENPFYVKKD